MPPRAGESRPAQARRGPAGLLPEGGDRPSGAETGGSAAANARAAVGLRGPSAGCIGPPVETASRFLPIQNISDAGEHVSEVTFSHFIGGTSKRLLHLAFERSKLPPNQSLNV